MYQKAGEFYLRSQNLWAGDGKALGKLIAQNDMKFSARYEKAFSEAFGGEFDALLELVADILGPHESSN